MTSSRAPIRIRSWWIWVLASVLWTGGCSKHREPNADAASHWLEACTTSEHCGDDSVCVCGVCTAPCYRAADCGGDVEASCVDEQALPPGCRPSTSGASTSVCLADCASDADCDGDLVCAAGACAARKLAPAPSQGCSPQCDLAAGETCSQGECRSLCAMAALDPSYLGCEFFAADLDNAAVDDSNDASAQQYAVVVVNPQSVVAEVRVEVNDAPFGEAPQILDVKRILVAPGGQEALELPRREVDGSTQGGLDDGTHTAVTSNAFRIQATHPIAAYQFNPLQSDNVFSSEASLLIPTSAIGREYTVVGWPQTIGDSENPESDFDPTAGGEDLRAFLTILGTREATSLEIELGSDVVRVVGADRVPTSGPDDVLKLEIGPFDVVNLETDELNADFTGSQVRADKPVSVFVGSEASDVPVFGTYAKRQCCADHLEDQILPDTALGNHFVIGRMPSRTRALEAAGFNVAVADAPEWARVVPVSAGSTRVDTSLPAPDDRFELAKGEAIQLRGDRDFVIRSDKPVSVLQALPSQDVTGIPRDLPGGDPAILAVPPVQQFRTDYVFLTPHTYSFDFVTIIAEPQAEVLLDGKPLGEHSCEPAAPADGVERDSGDAEPPWVVHRCQLSFPSAPSPTDSTLLAGDQNDGVHTLVSDREVGIVVYGFDRSTSYAYAGGLNLASINE